MSNTVMSTTASSIFTAYQVEKLGDVQRFIVHIQDLDIAKVAAVNGYTGDEHSFALKHISIAQGQNVPFEHSLSEQQRKVLEGAPSAQVERIRALDKFENIWFPRTRTALVRFIVADQSEAFVAAFFEDMEMQPEGPGVVASVKKYDARVESLATSKVPGAAEAYDSLVKRGLTKNERKRIRGLITECEQEAPAPARPKVKAETIAAGAAERLDAYDKLNKWYNDWAETLRSELTYHQSVRLGIIANKGGRKPAPQEPSPNPGRPENE